jgi:hypothetical protein
VWARRPATTLAAGSVGQPHSPGGTADRGHPRERTPARLLAASGAQRAARQRAPSSVRSHRSASSCMLLVSTAHLVARGAS